jgi:hypothetical protein
METYYAASNFVDFTYTLASLLRSIMNFESSNSSPLIQALRGNLTKAIDENNNNIY